MNKLLKVTNKPENTIENMTKHPRIHIERIITYAYICR